ncbi:unnamed protein product, partial [Effrenium voratum]
VDEMVSGVVVAWGSEAKYGDAGGGMFMEQFLKAQLPLHLHATADVGSLWKSEPESS